MSLVTLLKPSRFRDWRQRRRIEVLHETLAITRQNGTRIANIAMANLERWAKDKPAATNATCKVLVFEGDLLDTAQRLTIEHGVMFACLNMANAVFPGGGYTEGCSAQEENMVRRTPLHDTFGPEVAERRGGDTVYTKEMTDLLNAVNGEVYLSAEPVVCIRGCEHYDAKPSLGYTLYSENSIFPFKELRAAAIDLRGKKRRRDSDDSFAIHAEMTQRIRAQFETLKNAGVRHVVLSAFGCGAFKNDPVLVASAYAETIRCYKDDFAVIAFAIYYAGHSESNYAIFKALLQNVMQKPKRRRADDQVAAEEVTCANCGHCVPVQQLSADDVDEAFNDSYICASCA